MSPARLLDDLGGVVGAANVLTGSLTLGHRTDWTGRWHGDCLAVVRPGSTDEVSAVLAICSRHRAPVVTQGGNTGLVGGAVPTEGSIVLSTARLSSISEVDPRAGQVTAGAGATLAEVARVAAEAGWRYPVDFAARDTATIGGTIATNAGGHHVLRHGMTRRHVVGIEAVLADGRVVSHLSGLVKDNTGYDLAGLLCGSEGTLGVVTAARLALVAPAGRRAVALVGLATLDQIGETVGRLRVGVPEIEALELMTADGLVAVARHRGVSPPLSGCEAVLLVEVVSHGDPVELLEAAVADLDVADSAVAVDRPAIDDLWRWRDAHTEVINAVGPHPPHKFDVSVPLDGMARFVADVRAAVAARHPGAVVWIFGHAGDGNLHVNVTGPPPDDDSIDDLVLTLTAEASGSISAEHGIGRAKRRWLHLSRSQDEIDVFRSLKRALDPEGLLNPGVLLP